MSCPCKTASLNAISCVKQQREFNRAWNEHSTTSDSLFGSTTQDLTICGHNASFFTVQYYLSTLLPCFLETSLDACCSSHTRHALARHCCFCWAGRAFACRHPECQAETWTRWACVECRSGWEGAGSVTQLNAEIEESEHDWPGLWPNAITAASQRAEGLLLLRHSHPLPMFGQISQDDPPTAAQWPQPLQRCGLLGLVGHTATHLLFRN